MTKAEIAQLLTIASSIDSRKVTREMVEAWASVVSGIEYRVAVVALRRHWAGSVDWLLPAHIVQGAERAAEVLELESDQAAERAWLGTLGLTVEQYREHVTEPGWLESMRVRHDELSRGAIEQ